MIYPTDLSCLLPQPNNEPYINEPYPTNKTFQLIFFFHLRVHPPIKLRAKLLIGLSPNFTHIKIVSMRPPILNMRSISQFWQPWARNWQRCWSEKYAFTKNHTPPLVFAAHSSNFVQTLTTKLQRASRSWIFDFHPRSPLKDSKFLKADFSRKFSAGMTWIKWRFQGYPE